MENFKDRELGRRVKIRADVIERNISRDEILNFTRVPPFEIK